MKSLRKAISVILAVTLLVGVFTVYASDNDAPFVPPAAEELPHTSASGTFKSTYDGKITKYTDSNNADVPVGYFGDVIKVEPGTDGAYAGCEFDFSDRNIPTDSIESITFRVFLPVGHTEMRLLGEKAPTTWVMRAAPSTFGEWCDITLTADGQNFQSGMSMSSLANSGGNLGKICLIGRLDKGTDRAYYLDLISIKYKSGTTNDTTPPVITYEGESEVTVYAGDMYYPTGLNAHDSYDNAPASISTSWSAGAVSGGTLNPGAHILTVTATDMSGNSSSIAINVNVITDSSVINLDTIPYTDFRSDKSVYDGKVENLTAEQAAAEGVPAGYTGNVLKVSSTTARFGMTFDPTELNIPADLIEKMTVRILLYTEENGFRLSNHGATNWNVLQNASVGSWMDVVLTADGSGFSNGKFANLADEDGDLGIFGIATNDKSGKLVFYIDSIVINLKKDDGSAPVINYNGKTDILTSAEKPFALDISAKDTLSGKNLPLEYTFSEGAVDGLGNLVIGEHTCRVSATNYYGHTSYIDFNITVGPKDVEAPEILFDAEHVYAPAGAFWCVHILGIDNYDDVVVEEKWSRKPMDIGGRLIKGEYTLTLTVKDLSGNTATKTVYLHVTEEDTTVGSIVSGARK